MEMFVLIKFSSIHYIKKKKNEKRLVKLKIAFIINQITSAYLIFQNHAFNYKQNFTVN